MLLIAFQNERKLAQILNGKENIGFDRQHSDAMNCLSSWRVQQAQWDKIILSA